MTRNEQMLLATAVLQAIEKHDTRQRMRPRIVDEPAGPRVRIGHSLDSYAYITLEGRVQLSHGVPLRWRGGLRVVLENLGVYAYDLVTDPPTVIGDNDGRTLVVTP